MTDDEAETLGRWRRGDYVAECGSKDAALTQLLVDCFTLGQGFSSDHPPDCHSPVTEEFLRDNGWPELAGGWFNVPAPRYEGFVRLNPEDQSAVVGYAHFEYPRDRETLAKLLAGLGISGAAFAAPSGGERDE